MLIKQLSIFIENEAGRLASVTELLGEANINISALSVADTKEFGILRLIVTEPEKAYKLLKSNGYSVSLTDVICIATPHVPGALAKALHIISENNISVEYMYAFGIGEKASVVLKIENPEGAIKALQSSQLELLKASDIHKI